MHQLSNDLYFPPAHKAHTSGIVALGGDLSPQRILLAYQNGIFPWYEDGEPITWWSPEERMVLFPNTYKPSKSLRNTINKKIFTISFNKDFRAVMTACQQTKRKDQNGTWINDEMIESYYELHLQGHAQSVEVWYHNQLVGGLYGIDLSTVFCGESMFSIMSNASKVAFWALITYLQEHHYHLLDAQVYNEHLESLGCVLIDRSDFLDILKLPKRVI